MKFILPSCNGYYHQQVQSLLANKVLHLLNANTINGQLPNGCNCFCFQNSILILLLQQKYSKMSNSILIRNSYVTASNIMIIILFKDQSSTMVILELVATAHSVTNLFHQINLGYSSIKKQFI